MNEFHFTFFQKILMSGGVLFLLLVLIVYLFLKSIGEDINREYLRGNNTKDDLKRWESKANSKYSKFLFEIVRRVRHFAIVMAVVFFI